MVEASKSALLYLKTHSIPFSISSVKSNCPSIWGILKGVRFRPPPICLSASQQIRHLRGLLRPLKDKENLKERRLAGIAPGVQALDQQRKRKILMRERAQDHTPDLVQELPERRISAQIRAHDYGVDEIPDDAGEFSLASPRGWRAHQDVFLTGVAVKQYLEGRQQHHVKRHSLIPGQPTQKHGQIIWKFEEVGSSVMAVRRGPRPIRWQI